MSELLTTVRDAVGALAKTDPTLRRFGAAHHRYVLAAPLAEAEVVAIERGLGAPLPDDYRAFVREVAAGGAGPAYGLLPLDRIAIALAHTGATTLAIAHLGCGYAATLRLADGQIAIDARAIGVTLPIHASFTAFYADWIDRLARGSWPASCVPPGACALARALGGYLAMCERRLGLAEGGLDGAPLREALDALGPGAIAIAAEAADPLFAPGDRVDPCISCARTLENLGLGSTVVAPGISPLPIRQ